MTVIWSPFAQANLREIGAYYGARNPEATKAMMQRIVTSANRLRDYPQLGRLNKFKTCRLLQVPNTNYLLPYRRIGLDLEILAVFDQRQERPEKWQ
jgi:addiction module RelE/StbE family toxin